MTDPTIDQLLDAFDDILRTTVSLARDLSEDDADRPTDCPGWTVRDQLAHMTGLEQVLGGAPQPDIELPPLDHVRTDFDGFMERQVHVRRQLPLSAIADELDGLRRRRSSQLRGLAAEGDPEVPGPFGMRKLSASLPIRVFDLWAHEQDIRRAVGLPVRQHGEAASISLGRALLGWTVGFPKALDGHDLDLVVEVTDPEPSTTAVTIGAGGPTVTIRGDLATVTWLFCGRGAATDEVSGDDPELVAAVRERLAFTP